MKQHHLILAAVIACTASCSTITPETTTSTKEKHGVPGGEYAETSTIKATVTGIDAASRKVTLVTPQGKKFTVKASPEVVNFKQIHIGDQLVVTVTSQVVVRMAKKGEKTEDGGVLLSGTAPKGSKPGAYAANSESVTATVSAIDLEKRKATLLFPDGKKETFPVRPDVDLTKRKVGDKVVIEVTGIAAIVMKKP